MILGKGGAAFIVGIIKAILNSAGFTTKKVEYFTNESEDNKTLYPSTSFYIEFEPEAIGLKSTN